MSTSSSDGSVEFVVSHQVAEAARRDGVSLPEGHRVRLTLITSNDDEPVARDIPWIGKARSGNGDLGSRTKDILREEMGR